MKPTALALSPGVLILIAFGLGVAIVPGALTQDAPEAKTAADVFPGRPYSPYANRGYPTKVLFVDTHVHSALSADAGGGGTTLMPRDMYRFARGDQVTSTTGQPVKLARPFDFYMLTEHTDGIGVITDILKGTPAILADPQGKKYHEDLNAGGERARQASDDLIKQFSQGTLSDMLVYRPGNPAYASIWSNASGNRH